LRKVANSVLDDESPQRDSIPAWIEQKEAVVLDDDDENPSEYITEGTPVRTKQEPEEQVRVATKIEPPQEEAKEAKSSAKKAKRDAKEARKRERAEKREAKKAKKEAKKAKKEGKKRKRDE